VFLYNSRFILFQIDGRQFTNALTQAQKIHPLHNHKATTFTLALHQIFRISVVHEILQTNGPRVRQGKLPDSKPVPTLKCQVSLPEYLLNMQQGAAVMTFQ
jgi:hypothetical protein